MSDQNIEHVESVREAAPARGRARVAAAFRPGEREFYGGLAAITICCAIAMMRGGPEAGFAATSAGHSPAVGHSSEPVVKSPVVEERQPASNTRVRALR